MTSITITPSELSRLQETLKNVPPDNGIVLTKEVTSEFGYSVFVKYLNKMEWNFIDITSTDNF